MISKTHARALARRGLPCAVPNCGKHVHGLSNYCSRHHNNLLRHGSPDHRALRLYELRHWLTRVQKFVVANEADEALSLAISELHGWLSEGARVGEGYLAITKRMPSWQHRMAAECYRLRQNGVTGRDLFETVCAVYMLSQSDPRRLEPFSRPHYFATSRLSFNLAPRAGKRRYNQAGTKVFKYVNRLSSELLYEFGKRIVMYLLPLLQRIQKAFHEREHRDETKRTELVEALKQSAFAVELATA